MKNFDDRIEALRGIVAFIVVFHHFYIHGEYFDIAFSVKNYWAPYNPPGHLSVLIFFVLSGYVIGLTYKNENTPFNSVSYIKKRFVRIYPILFISLVFTYLFLVKHYVFSDILSNFLLYNVPNKSVVAENPPIWSLHFEVLFYLLFIIVALSKLNPKWIFSLLIITSLSLNLLLPYTETTALLISYVNGYAFWMAGLMIAQTITKRSEPFHVNQYIAVTLFLFSQEVLNPFEFFCKKLHIPINYHPEIDWFLRSISSSDMFYLPYCILLIIILSNRKFRGLTLFTLIVYILPIIPLLPHIKNANWHLVFTEENNMPLLIWVLSGVLWFVTIRRVPPFIKKISWLGNISYGVYIIHYPLLQLFGRYYPASPSLPLFITKMIVYFICMIAFAFILEKVFQPYSKKIFIKN